MVKNNPNAKTPSQYRKYAQQVKMSSNMTADDYIDYLYDDKEDFFSNVDYTMPDNFGYLDQMIAYRLNQSPYEIFGEFHAQRCG